MYNFYVAAFRRSNKTIMSGTKQVDLATSRDVDNSCRNFKDRNGKDEPGSSSF